MPTSIAILGAAGAVGTTLAAQILRTELLQPMDRLQLVGHGLEASEQRLLSTRIDLLDAYDDERVDVEVVPETGDVDADIVVVCAGVGVSPKFTSRRDMGLANRPVFEEIAEHCARRVPDALVVVVSNPVELGVQILGERLGRKRVIGMGAEQDSLRFSRAIARDMGASRREVRASVLGEHGEAMVPIWSTVELPERTPELETALAELRSRAEERPLHERVKELRAEVTTVLDAGQVAEAYELARRALPDARIFVEPFITFRCMHSTPNATANATLQCLAAALGDDERRLHGQVLLEGEVEGLHGVCGVPLTLSRDGWRAEAPPALDAEERTMLHDAARAIREFVDGVLAQPRLATES